jgi:hypothetical protein
VCVCVCVPKRGRYRARACACVGEKEWMRETKRMSQREIVSAWEREYP